MFIPPGYANCQVILHHEATQQTAVTAIGVLLEAADLPDVANGIGVAWTDAFAGDIGEDWGNGTVRITLGTSDPSAPVTYEVNYTEMATNTSATAPPQVALLLRKQTLTGGRAGKGRMYIVGPGEAGIDSAGNFSPSQHDANQDNADQFLTAVKAITGVESAYLFHTDPDDDPSEIVSLQAVQMVATQRRRLR